MNTLFYLANAPSVFQSFVNEVLRDMLHRFVVVYIDDILIYSDNVQDHVKHVKAVLNRLLENDLFVKAEKCLFHLIPRLRVEFTGSADG